MKLRLIQLSNGKQVLTELTCIHKEILGAFAPNPRFFNELFAVICTMEEENIKVTNRYLKELIEKIECIEIWHRATGKCSDYDEGIKLLVNIFMEHKEKNSQLFFIGNGGSSAIASHMTADFMKNGGMKTYSLYDNAVTTCMGNDYGYEYIFSRPLDFLIRNGDMLVAISSSGNSLNIVNAVEIARKKGATIITFTGFEPDNRIKGMGDVNVYVPCNKYGIVESVHNLILQQIVDMIMERDGAKF